MPHFAANVDEHSPTKAQKQKHVQYHPTPPPASQPNRKTEIESLLDTIDSIEEDTWNQQVI